MTDVRQSTQTASRSNHPQLMTAIALIAVAGIAVSSVSLYEHFAASTTSFCDFSETFNCDLVNRSPYSTFLGIPVALIGVAGYSLIAIFSSVYRNQPQARLLLLIASAGGSAFALYLTYVEKFVLDAWCILCLTSLGLICGEVILSAAALLGSKSGDL